MASFGGMAFYEALRSLRGLFSSGSADISITQQQASALLPTRDDEAIQLALDATLVEQSGGLEHLARIQKVRKALEPHQRTDWRVNLGSLKMTERFEQVMISETTTVANPGDPADPPLGQRRRNTGQKGQQRVERKFDRRQRDYEWTAEDPRIKHLLLVSALVENNSVSKAKAYLLTAGLIKEKSTAQQASEKVSAAWETSAAGVHNFIAARQLGSEEMERIKTMSEGEARNRELTAALDCKRHAVKEKLKAVKHSGLPRWFWILCIVGTATFIGICVL